MKLIRTLLIVAAIWPATVLHASEQTPTEICPVTWATEFELPDAVHPDDIWGSGLIHNNDVGVLLARNGIIIVREDNRGEKISWWKKDASVNMTASTRNVFTGEEVLDIKLEPYASYLQEDEGIFLMSGVSFSTDGCWELIATSGDSELRVTVLVVALPTSDDID